MAEVTVTTQATVRVQLDAVDEHRLSQLETRMSENTAKIEAIQVEVEAWKADIEAKVAALEALIPAPTDPTEAQAISDALDNLKASVDSGVASIGDANNDGTPAATDIPGDQPESAPAE